MALVRPVFSDWPQPYLTDLGLGQTPELEENQRGALLSLALFQKDIDSFVQTVNSTGGDSANPFGLLFELFNAEYERALEISRVEYERLTGAGMADAAPYALCLGYRIRYVLDLNAREAMQLIELRSGREGHPSYRAVAHETVFHQFMLYTPVPGTPHTDSDLQYSILLVANPDIYNMLDCFSRPAFPFATDHFGRECFHLL